MAAIVWLTLWPLWCALLLAPAIMMSPGGLCCKTQPCSICSGISGDLEVTLAGYAFKSGSTCDAGECEELNATWVLPFADEDSGYCYWIQTFQLTGDCPLSTMLKITVAIEKSTFIGLRRVWLYVENASNEAIEVYYYTWIDADDTCAFSAVDMGTAYPSSTIQDQCAYGTAELTAA